ncbi:hypothetical protein [Nonomuraea gerenzanensis]|nr:hypothetical protein [Nonomuraea gerenzanensis]UBU16070.1 hypothetical protein LCN96_13985 [Nonomuraea gerenzanensis]
MVQFHANTRLAPQVVTLPTVTLPTVTPPIVSLPIVSLPIVTPPLPSRITHESTSTFVDGA